MKEILKFLLFSILSVLLNLIEIFIFAIIFVVLIDQLISPIRNGMTDFIFLTYLVLFFLFNVGLTIFLVSKIGVNRFFYIHILFSLLAMIPLVGLIGAFYR